MDEQIATTIKMSQRIARHVEEAARHLRERGEAVTEESVASEVVRHATPDEIMFLAAEGLTKIAYEVDAADRRRQ